MTVYRVLGVPRLFNESVWGVKCALGHDGNYFTDVVLFDDEDMAWKFYHEATRQFEPMVITDGT